MPKQFYIYPLMFLFGLSNLSELEAKAAPKKSRIVREKSKYILMDYGTDIVLEESESEARIAPSSMTKLMTLYVLFSQLKAGIINLKTEFLVSRQAKRTGGSKSFLEEGHSVNIDTLIRCIIVHSGNDASVVVAEGISGSVEKFVGLMNNMAKKIGAVNSHFCNPTGLPDEDHYSTVKDIAIIAKRLIADFPEFYHYFSEKEFEINGIRQVNRNKLLWKNFGVDGLKTGHTNAGGYGLAASAKKENARLISVVNGCSSIKQREEESENLLRRGFNMISTYNLVKKYRPIKYIDVWLGNSPTIPIVSIEDINITVLRENIPNLKIYLKYKTPIMAPVKAGAVVAELVVENGDKTTRYPLVAGKSASKLNALYRGVAAAKYMLFGNNTKSENLPKNENKKVIN